MIDLDLIIRGRRVVLPDAITPASIHVQSGRIRAVESFDQLDRNSHVVDVDEHSVVMPGLVDTHVHINSPGRTEWEGFESATRAGAAGGVTTLVDMPLNSIPPTTTVAALTAKMEAATDHCYVDMSFWGGVIPGNTCDLEGLAAAGVVGFKCFLAPSGVDEFPNVTEADLRVAMPELSRLDALLIVHAELPRTIEEASNQFITGNDPNSYQTFLASRPRAAENEAVELMIQLSREFGTRVHIVHLSSAEAIPMLREAQSAGVKITAETCPHYLHFAAEDIVAGATVFKCCPPIRERANREELWKALAESTIDIVVSDHSPCPGEMKLPHSGNFLDAWGGISSLQLRLPVMWTNATERGFSISDLARWLCHGPARQVGLQKKGAIVAGNDADFVIWNPEREFEVEPGQLQHRHKITPYAGAVLRGVVEKTFLRGRKIYDGSDIEAPPSGRLVLLGK